MTGTFDPKNGQPSYIKALEFTNKVIARETSGKLSMLKDVTVTMSPLTGADDLKLKTVRTDLRTFNRFINELIYSHGKFDGIEFIDFEDFLSKFSIPDKQIALALLMDASYQTLPEVGTICPKCETVNNIEPRVSIMFNYEDTKIPVWDHEEPFYEKVFEKVIQLGSTGKIKVGIKFATEAERDKIFSMMSLDTAKKNLLNSGGLLDSTDTLLMFVEYIIVEGKDPETGEKTKIELRDKLMDIQGFLNRVPLEIHDQINEFINETFSDYYPQFYHPVTCKECGEDYKWAIDIETEFFRKAVPFY